MKKHENKLAQNWRTFANDKQIEKCYNDIVQKWDRAKHPIAVFKSMTLKAAFFIARNL